MRRVGPVDGAWWMGLGVWKSVPPVIGSNATATLRTC